MIISKVSDGISVWLSGVALDAYPCGWGPEKGKATVMSSRG